MKIRHALIPAVAGGLGLALGYAFGHGRGFEMAMEFERTEVRGGLFAHGEALCALRFGETEGAIRVLEALLDNAASSLPEGRAVSELPVQSQRALAAAKVYRAAFPVGTPNAELERVLSQVVLPEFRFCPNIEGSGLDRMRERLRVP